MAVLSTIIILSLGVARADYLLMPDAAVAGPRTQAPTVPDKAKVDTPPNATNPPNRVTPPTTPTRTPSPACSSRTDEVKEMIAKVMKTNVFDISWREDVAKVGSSGRFVVKDVKGSVRINMINGDGHSVGIAPARFCLSKVGGQLALKVGLQRSYLKFGRKFGFIDLDAQVNDLLAKLPNPSELPLIVTRGQNDTKIHIADGMGRETIDSDFSPSAQ